MTDKLNEEIRLRMAVHRMSRADEAMKDAEMCADHGRYILAINRLYYACYYIVSALLLVEEIDAATHKGVKSMFYYNFVATGKIEKNIAKTFSQLFDSRHTGDYDDFIIYDETDYNSLKPRTDEFLQTVRKMINI